MPTIAHEGKKENVYIYICLILVSYIRWLFLLVRDGKKASLLHVMLSMMVVPLSQCDFLNLYLIANTKYTTVEVVLAVITP